MKELENKVCEFGAAYGMDIYSTKELLSLATGVAVEKLEGTVSEILQYPSKLKGVGKKKELAFFAISELAKRLTKQGATEKTTIRNPEEVADFARPYFVNEYKEHFSIIMLNTQNQIIGLKHITIGSLNASIVHPREVFETAIMHHSASIILVHNHPSGNVKPSPEDRKITERLVKAGKVMGIDVLDHIIIGSGTGYFLSMKERGMC